MTVNDSDPVRARLPLPLGARYFPLGFPCDVQTNSPAVLEAACQSWSCFEQAFDLPPIVLVMDIQTEPRPSGRGHDLPTFRSRAHLLSINADPHNLIVCDLAGSEAFGWLTSGLVAQQALFRYHFLEAAALALLTHAHLAPVHAALVEFNGAGVLLCGETCAGKSTLAYACARDGWTYICDDGAHLVRSRSDCFAIGDCHHFRLREGARELFPELAGRIPAACRNGKTGIELDAAHDVPHISRATGASVEHVVFLKRGPHCESRLRPFSRETALARLYHDHAFGTDAAREQQRRCFERLAARPVWELTYSDLAGAVERLRELAETGQ